MLPKKQKTSSAINPGSVVIYEQHSKPILAIAKAESKGKWTLENQLGKQVNLPSQRIYVVPGESVSGETKGELQALRKRVDQKLESISIDEAWKLLLEESKEFDTLALASLLFGSNGFLEHLSARILLLEDRIYFKRKANSFEPREESAVEQLRHQIAVEEKRQRSREELRSAIVARMKDSSVSLPSTISHLEALAIQGGKAPQAKEYSELLNEIIERLRLPYKGKIEEKALRLLIKVGHFDEDIDLNLLKMRRPIEFSEACLAEAESLKPSVSEGRQDLRHLLTISIDGEETLDYDDALSLVETDTGTRLYIHISDVASLIPKDSALEANILRRGTSIYCADRNIPMLPRSLSEDLISLRAGEDRLALTTIIDFDVDGTIVDRSLQHTVIRVDKNLRYNSVNEVLYSESPSNTEENSTLLKLWDLTCKLEARRVALGSTQLQRREFNPKLTPEKKILLEENSDDLPGNKLVGEMMILTNETGALFASERDIPLLFRSQPPPETNLELASVNVVEGPAREYFLRGQLKRSEISTNAKPHFGLGVDAYAQLTSPIRRASDFLNQRQLVAHISGQGKALTSAALEKHHEELALPLEEAQVIQNSRQRYWLLRYFQQEGIKEFEATVVRIDGAKPLAELQLSRTLIPFNALGKKKLGDKVVLKAEKISPRGEVFRLVEICSN